MCEFLESGSDSTEYYGRILDFPFYTSAEEGKVCKVFFYFRAANCGSACDDDSRTVYIFSYKNMREKEEQYTAFFNLLSL